MASEREAKLEAMLTDFVSCIESVGAQQWWEEGAVDLLYLYEDVCFQLGREPQPYDSDEEEDIETLEDLEYIQESFIP